MNHSIQNTITYDNTNEKLSQNKRKMTDILSDNMPLNVLQAGVSDYPPEDSNINPESIKIMMEKYTNEEYEENSLDYLTDEDFMNLTKLNKPVLVPDFILFAKLIISYEDLNKVVSTDLFQDHLNKNHTVQGSIKRYESRVFETLYYIITNIYVEKLDDERYQKDSIFIEQLLSLLLTQKQDAGFVLNKLIKILLQKKCSKSYNRNDHKKKLKLCIDQLIKESQQNSELNNNNHLSDNQDTTTNDYLTIYNYFGEAHSELYEQVKAFFELGSIFKNIVSPSNVTFKSLTKSHVKTKKLNQDITKEALKVTFTVPCYVRFDQREVKRYKINQISDDDSIDLIKALKRDLRFPDNKELNFYENVTFVTANMQMKMIKVHDTIEGFEKDLKTENCLSNDIEMSFGSLYAIIDHIKITTVDELNKHSLRSWPIKLINPQSTNESICCINFATDGPIEDLRTRN